jgi:hypothetical protein
MTEQRFRVGIVGLEPGRGWRLARLTLMSPGDIMQSKPDSPKSLLN